MGKAKDPVIQGRKERLQQYIYLKGEYEDYQEELTRLENNAYIPGQKESDGSKKNPGASDRMANATIRYMEYRDEVAPEMARIKEEMAEIESAITNLRDGMERRVMRLRYIHGEDGDVRDQMPWKKVALKIYKRFDEATEQAVHRTHGRALQNIKLEGFTE